MRLEDFNQCGLLVGEVVNARLGKKYLFTQTSKNIKDAITQTRGE